MKNLILTAFLLFSSVLTFSQWTSNYGGSGDANFTNAKGNAVTSDNLGNSYVTGYTYETGYPNDILIVKYSQNGSVIWDRAFNGTANLNDEGLGIYVDNAGNIYVVGTAQYSGKSYDAILLKYSNSGTLLWSRTYSSTTSPVPDKGLGIAVDASSNIYVTGYTTNTDGYTDIFTWKCDPSGNPIWVATEDGTSHLDAQGVAIQVGPTGNVYVAGYVTASGTNTDMALIKYNSTGTRQWIQTVNGTGNGEDKAWGMVIDDSDNPYITGYTTVCVGNTDCYTAKYTSAGTQVWYRTYNGTGNQTDKAWGIVVDTDGSIYIAGETTCTLNNVNYLAIKYNAQGTQIWTSFYNGTGNGDDRASAIAILPGNCVVVTGKSWGTAQNYDYATVRFSLSDGGQSQVNRYSFSGNTDDIAKDVAVTSTGKVLVTGYSQFIVESSQEQSYLSTISLDWGAASELHSGSGITTPDKFSLYQNYPNPFNPSTNIKFDLPFSSAVKLTIYDVLGKTAAVLVNQQLEAGTYNISYSNQGLSSGIYFYELTAGSYREIKKMNLIK